MLKKQNILLLLPFIFFLLFSCSNERIVFETTHLKPGIDNKGFIPRLEGIQSKTSNIPRGLKSPVLALYKDPVYYEPVSAHFDYDKRELVLAYQNGFRDQLFEAVREWQKARHTKAFSPDQIERLKDSKGR